MALGCQRHTNEPSVARAPKCFAVTSGVPRKAEWLSSKKYLAATGSRMGENGKTSCPNKGCRLEKAVLLTTTALMFITHRQKLSNHIEKTTDNKNKSQINIRKSNARPAALGWMPHQRDCLTVPCGVQVSITAYVWKNRQCRVTVPRSCPKELSLGDLKGNFLYFTKY